MKLALVHDWLTNLAGAERVILAMHELWPEAPIHTALYAPDALSAAYQPGAMDVRTSWLQRLPGATKRWRHLLPLMPTAFERFDLSGYDVVVSSAHACAKGVLTPSETCHICYCYTPIRYLWEMPHEYLAAAGPLQRLLWPPIGARLRVWDYVAAQRVDRFIAISQAVRRRIAKHYRRDADVIYPPVDTSQYEAGAEREDFYLIVSRFVPYKRVDLAAEVCTALGRRLKVVGTGPDEAKVRAAAGPTVELLGYRADHDVRELYARAKGFLFCGLEDFGLTPVEAQASGCPVIAYGAGGALETVVEGQTGVFFREPTAAALTAAITRFESATWSAAACRENASRFDLSVFNHELRTFVEASVAAHQAGRQA